MIKSIGAQSRIQIQKLIAGEVYLKLFIKVEPNWRFSNTHLADFGYGYEEWKIIPKNLYTRLATS